MRKLTLGKIVKNGVTYSGSSDNADNVKYNNNASNLDATNVQEAIDKLDESVDTLNSNLDKKNAWSYVEYTGIKQTNANDIVANTWIKVNDCYIDITPGVWNLQIFVGCFTNASDYKLGVTFYDSLTNDKIAWAEIMQENYISAQVPSVFQRYTSQGLWVAKNSRKLTVEIYSTIAAPCRVDVEAVAYPLRLF